MKLPQPSGYGRLLRGPVILLVLIVALPLLLRGPYEYLLPLVQLCGIYAIIVTGLTLLMGFTGQISLGHAGFYGLGAYAAAVAATVYHAPIWLCIAFAVAAGAVLAFITGFSILRLKGHHLALATLCVGVIIFEMISKMEITGGAAGLLDLPEVKFFGLAESPLGKLYLIWCVLLLAIVWSVLLTESPAGRALKAIHGDEDAAESLGISAFSVKLKVFIASGVLAAIAGVLYAFVYSPSYVGPEEFGLMLSVMLVTMAVIGGMGSIWGGIVGAVVLRALHEIITLIGDKLGSTDIARYEQLIFGLLLVLIMIYSREGLVPGLRSLVMRSRK